ncbi:TPA: hypothetical protein SMJ49_000905 [Klebsiella oxytoca]|jgi:hypothetical protein|nr:hypothetical protein [Klebsiella oxytoca]
MQHVPANAYQQPGPSLCKTSPAAVLYPTMTSAPGAGISATGLVNLAFVSRLMRMVSGPHGAISMAMHNPAHGNS